MFELKRWKNSQNKKEKSRLNTLSCLWHLAGAQRMMLRQRPAGRFRLLSRDLGLSCSCRGHPLQPFRWTRRKRDEVPDGGHCKRPWTPGTRTCLPTQRWERLMWRRWSKLSCGWRHDSGSGLSWPGRPRCHRSSRPCWKKTIALLNVLIFLAL